MLHPLEATLHCENALTQLEAKMDAHLSVHDPSDPLRVLRQIKIFLNTERAFRERVLGKTILHGSDCLTLSVITLFLARRKGVVTHLAIPRRISGLFHAVLVYSNKGKPETFIVAGKTAHPNPRLIGMRETLFRLRVTKPLVRSANTMKALVRPKTKRNRRSASR